MIRNYNELVQAVMAVAEDDGTEFQAYIPTAIDLAEARLTKTVGSTGRTEYVNLTLTQGQQELTKPSGFRVPRSLEIRDSSGVTTELLLRTHTFIRDYWPNISQQGFPKYYSNETNTLLRVVPTPDSNYSVTLGYEGRPPRLSSTNQTNFFVDVHPEALFYATMSEIAAFQKAWSQVPIWEQKFVDAISNTTRESQRQERDDNSRPMSGDYPRNEMINRGN